MREWRALFEMGMPLYEERAVEETTDPTVGQVLEEEKLQLLDEGDFMEYKVSHYLLNTWWGMVGVRVSYERRDRAFSSKQ